MVINLCEIEGFKHGLRNFMPGIGIKPIYISCNFLRRDIVTPNRGKITAAQFGIFCYVSGDIRKLHPNAQIDGKNIRALIQAAQYWRHHKPDSPGYLVGVNDQLILIIDRNRALIKY